MDKGMICIPLMGPSAVFVAYWSPCLFVSSKTMPFKTNLHGFQQKSNSFAGADSSCDSNTAVWQSVPRNILQPVGV